eukprot:5617971-Pyramimonas_sp.AAC.1
MLKTSRSVLGRRKGVTQPSPNVLQQPREHKRFWLEDSWAVLEASWKLLGPPWAILGHVGYMWGQIGAIL